MNTRHNTRSNTLTPYKQAYTAEHSRVALLLYTLGMTLTIYITCFMFAI
jgi:hypothetical protein